MAKIEMQHAWNKCAFCSNLEFKAQNDFICHLREKHCAREGGSYVCRYGYNDVCSSLPVEGVSDEDYEDHVYKHHVGPIRMSGTGTISRRSSMRKISSQELNDHQPSLIADGQQWNVYSASQNLAAVLNDPNRGKQRDFFTRTWGDGFVEKTDIQRPSYLPEITVESFELYLKKIARRYRKHARMNSASLKQNNRVDLRNHFPGLKSYKSQEIGQFDINNIPKIFLQSDFQLSNRETFHSVFPFLKESMSPFHEQNSSSSTKLTSKLFQEKLSQYLDMVEVQIARQVSQKSDAFFHAMTSHDALMEQLTQTITVVKALRGKVQHMDNTLVKNSLDIMRLERRRRNQLLVFQKLKLMATVHQTQPTIQLLLSTPDYVAALDLISTTQEILIQELVGVQSFRHLGSQLLEMERLINKMLRAEFERYVTADLNRPLTDHNQVLEGDKLVSIIFGMLRQKHFHFIDAYKEETFTTINALVKQIKIEVIADSDSGDSELTLTGIGDQLQALTLQDWYNLMENITSTLLKLIYRVKAVHDVIKQAVHVTAGVPLPMSDSANEDTRIHVSFTSDPIDKFLNEEEHHRVTAKLSELLVSVCDYAHERIAQLVSAQTHQSPTFENEHQQSSRGGERQQSQMSQPSYWLADKATPAQVCDLARVIDSFTVKCEQICGKTSIALNSAFKVQASKFIHRFHYDRKNKLSLILDSERWKQADVPTEFQDLVDSVANFGNFAPDKRTNEAEIIDRKPADILLVNNEPFAVVGTVLLLLKIVAEYCKCAEDLYIMASSLCRQLAELLQFFNSRCCQLVLGADALQLAGLKTITSTNLALASRALQLVLWLIPYIRLHFQDLFESNQSNPQVNQRSVSGLIQLDIVEKDIRKHIIKIEEKVLLIMGSLMAAQLAQWDAKPPVPSQPFRNISKHLIKLYEAVANILPPSQIEDLYKKVHATFKEKLRDQLNKMNIINNGGPQHGVVTSEFMFYLETQRNLKALPQEELTESAALNSLWSGR